MNDLLASVAGKVFVHPETKEPYGQIRSAEEGRFVDLNGVRHQTLAEDSCGNYFVEIAEGGVGFWDHETDDIIPLADSVAKFISLCQDDIEIELDPANVKSVWIDPTFVKSLGMTVPKDGWVKRPINDNKGSQVG